MVNKKLLHEVVMNFIPTKKGIPNIDVKFKGPKPELGKSINGGSRLKENNNSKIESEKKNIIKTNEINSSHGGNDVKSLKEQNEHSKTLNEYQGGTKINVIKQKTESVKKNIVKPTEHNNLSGGNNTQKLKSNYVNTVEPVLQKTESIKNSNNISNGGSTRPKIESNKKSNNILQNAESNQINNIEGGNIKQKAESNKKSNNVLQKKLEQIEINIGGKNTSAVKQKTESNKKSNNVLQKLEQIEINIGGKNTSAVKQKTESNKKNLKSNEILSTKQGGLSKIKNYNLQIDDYKPNTYRSKKNEEYSKVKEYILNNGGQLQTNKEEIQKNSYREIVIPMDSKSKKSKSSKKNGGKKKNSKSKKRSSKKKSNIKIKSSAPNNLKNDIDNLIRSSKKMSFHRI